MCENLGNFFEENSDAFVWQEAEQENTSKCDSSKNIDANKLHKKT